MSPPIRYPTEDIRHALSASLSVIAAARLLGMSQGALRKRVGREPTLARVYARCLERGMARVGKKGASW